MPQAIDRVLRTPVIRARLPCRNPMLPPRKMVIERFSAVALPIVAF
jgi:hypothetical protein